MSAALASIPPPQAVARARGHLRLQVPGLYGSEKLKHSIESSWTGMRGVTAISASSLTGRVLVQFDPRLPSDVIEERLGVVKPPVSTSRPGSTRKKKPAPKSAAASQNKPPWHLMSAQDALARLDVPLGRGLSASQVAERASRGSNTLPAIKGRSQFSLLADQFKSLPVALLALSSALSLATGGLAEAASILAVLGLNGGIGFATEKRAEETIALLSELVEGFCLVLREGSVQQIAGAELVPGDLIVLAPGMPVGADARLVQSLDLTLDESTLTGESQAVSKTCAALAADAVLAERHNMVYMGTNVASGSGLALVVATGAHTELGRIQAAMQEAASPKTPMQQELDVLGNRLLKISGAACLAVLGAGLLRGRGGLPLLKTSISLAIAAVPEGLPTVATTSLARGMRVMLQRDMLVRRLHAVEALGAVHSVCFDKTGTLTANRMSVVAGSVAGHRIELEGAALSALPARLRADLASSRLLQLCILSNEASLQPGGIGAGLLSGGSSTENALVRLAEESGMNAAEVRAAWPHQQAELRAEGRNYIRSVHRNSSGGRLVAVKGNPLEVLALCIRTHEGSKVIELDDSLRARISRENDALASRQLRVLGFAYDDGNYDSDQDGGHGPRVSGLTWIGMLGLADPMRQEAKQVIAALQRAGIETRMITGDQCQTARALGLDLHLAADHELAVYDASQLDLTHGHALQQDGRADVYARVSPAHKLDIVRALQADGQVVAMVGDGINDGPALRASNVGIAMGQHGTDLARGAAEVVLANDRLDSLPEAIREGRTITDNIGKSLHFLLSSNLSEILVVLGSVASTGAAPLTPLQLLWINLITDVLPAVALAAEPPEHNVMERPPRPAGRELIAADDLKQYGLEGSLLAGSALAAWGYGVLRHGPGARAGSIAFNTLVLTQLLHALSCRSKERSLFEPGMPKNPRLGLAIGGSIAAQALANFLPGLRTLLGLGGGLGLADLGVVALAGTLPLFINESRKSGAGGNRHRQVAT